MNLKALKKTNQEKQEITPYEESRKEFIINLQALYKEGYTKKQIATMLKTTYKRIRKYLNGDPEHLCISGRKNSTRGSKLDGFKDIIHTLVCEGKQYKEIFSVLKFKGYTGGYSILCDYCSNILKESMGTKPKKMKIYRVFINRRDIFKHIWSDKVIDENDKKILYEKYPDLAFIHECVKDFRIIYEQKSVGLLHAFIDKYKKGKISNLSSFANGLLNDLSAVENSVTSPYSNGILEGNNNRLKLIKRTMYGRAKLPLLRAKVLTPILQISNYTQNYG